MISILQHARNQHCSAQCGWFSNMFQFSSFCFREYSLCFKGEFQCYLEGFYMHVFHWSVENYLCTRLQLNTKYKTGQLIRFIRRTETMTGLKKAPTKQPLCCEANYQRRITALRSKELSLQQQLQIKFNLSMWQTILCSTICPVLIQAIFKEISWPEYWSLLLNTYSFWCFFFKLWAGSFNVAQLAHCVAPFFGFLSH